MVYLSIDSATHGPVSVIERQAKQGLLLRGNYQESLTGTTSTGILDLRMIPAE